MTMTKGILVGVDGSEAGLRAVDYAASEAQRRDLPLRLLHVIPSERYLYPSMGSLERATQEFRRSGRAALADATTRAAAVVDEDRIETSLLAGDRLYCLVEVAREGALLVLGNERRGRLERLITGSVVSGLAAHSPIPVVVVPDSWTPETVYGRIVVGVKHYDDCEGLIRYALRLASERGAGLRVVYACDVPYPYDPSFAHAFPVHLWTEPAREALSRTLATLAADFSHVKAHVDVEERQPARSLVGASAHADVLVIQRCRHLLRIGHFGGTGRAVLREAHCPVEVLPAQPEEQSDLVLERDGGIEKTALDSD